MNIPPSPDPVAACTPARSGPNAVSALYRRVSTDHQDNSLEVQEHLNDEYCQRMGLTTHPGGSGGSSGLTYCDDDVSGSVPFSERTGGRALLNRLQLGDVKHLITAKQDRLGRDTLDSIGTIRRIWGLGITPHFTCEGGAFPRTPQNELLFEIKASVAQYERNLIRDRTRTVLRHKFNQGHLTGNVPFGWDCEYRFQDGTTHLSPKALSPSDLASLGLPVAGVTGKVLIANPAEQAVIRLMVQLRKAGLALNKIAEDLNARGHRTKLDRPWQTGTVDSVLNSRYTAKLLESEGKVAA